MFEPMSNFEQHVWQPMTELCLGDSAIAATESPQNTTMMSTTTAAVSTKFKVNELHGLCAHFRWVICYAHQTCVCRWARQQL